MMMTMMMSRRLIFSVFKQQSNRNLFTISSLIATRRRRIVVLPMIQNRFFAKQSNKNNNNNNNKNSNQVEFNSSSFDSELISSLTRLQEELAGVRTNRASPDLLQNIVVKSRDGGAAVTPLKALAQVSVKDPKTLLVSVFDDSMVSAVQSSIQQSDLGLNPTVFGASALLVPVPKLTVEFRDKLLKLVATAEENAKMRVRRERTNVLKHLKDCKLPEDESKRLEKVIDEQTKQFNKKATDFALKKTNEISSLK
jgi:ribosome recycling factor